MKKFMPNKLLWICSGRRHLSNWRWNHDNEGFTRGTQTNSSKITSSSQKSSGRKLRSFKIKQHWVKVSVNTFQLESTYLHLLYKMSKLVSFWGFFLSLASHTIYLQNLDWAMIFFGIVNHSTEEGSIWWMCWSKKHWPYINCYYSLLEKGALLDETTSNFIVLG